MLLESCDNTTMETLWSVETSTTLQVGDERATARVLVTNEASAPICSIHISPSTATDWGQNLLGAIETIPAGKNRFFYVVPGSYDLQATDCDGTVLSERYDHRVTGRMTWDITD
jgi:hypothetical protein